MNSGRGCAAGRGAGRLGCCEGAGARLGALRGDGEGCRTSERLCDALGDGLGRVLVAGAGAGEVACCAGEGDCCGARSIRVGCEEGNSKSCRCCSGEGCCWLCC